LKKTTGKKINIKFTYVPQALLNFYVTGKWRTLHCCSQSWYVGYRFSLLLSKKRGKFWSL